VCDVWLGTHAQRTALVMGLAGVCVLLAIPWLMSLSCMTTTTSADAKTVYITYVYPVDPFLPILLVAGVLLSVYGFWKSRTLLVERRRRIGWIFTLGSVLTVASLLRVEHVLAVSYDAYHYGFPFP
jgi:hypothetical protein